MEAQKQNLIITNEDEAYEFIKSWLSDEINFDDISLRFEGWPKLLIHLDGPKYHQTITPSLMKSFINLQTEIYRSYALTRYGSPNVRQLSAEERKQLEIEVKVSNGSSNYEVDIQALLQHVIDLTVGKLNPEQLMITVVSIAILYFGSSSWRSYLEYRKQTREKELQQDDQRHLINTLTFASEQETKRTQIMVAALTKEPKLENISRSAHDAHNAMLKSLGNADSSTLQGVDLDSDIATVLATNTRSESTEIRLDGTFRIQKVDSSNASEFRVWIGNIKTGETIDAVLQDATLDKSNIETLQKAEWERRPVELTINAKESKGRIKDAVILSVKKLSNEE